MENFYKQILDKSPIGYAYHRMIYTEEGRPFDYEYIEINSAFEEFTGLKRQNVIGRRIREIIPGIEKDQFDWIGFFGKVALDGGKEELEQYEENLDKYYRVNVFSPEKNYFIVLFTDITKERKELIQNKTLLTALNDAVFTLTADFNFDSIIEPNEELLFFSEKGAIGRNIVELFPLDFTQNLVQKCNESKASDIRVSLEYQSPHDTHNKWFKADIRHLQLNNEDKFVINVRDITEKKKAEETLFIEKEKFEKTLLSIGDGVISIDSNKNIRFMNAIAEELTGWRLNETEGRSFEEIFHIINQNTRNKVENPATDVLRTGKIIGLANHTLLIRKDGTEIAIEDSAAPIKDRYGTIEGVVLVFRDVTERVKARKKIEYLSQHDSLTGLYNRRHFETVLEQVNDPRKLPVSMLVIDVNGLKLTNDAFGHDKGDELLQSIAEILKGSVKDGDACARIGGDEFAIILTNTDYLHAEQLKASIARDVEKLELGSVVASVAIGCESKNQGSQDIRTVFKIAENHMYKDKIKTSKAMRNQTLKLIVDTINSEYEEEKAHTKRVSNLCHEIGLALKLSAEQLRDAELSGFFHDVGKIMVPYHILNKPGKLTDEEYELVKNHTESGYHILKSIEDFSSLAEYILCHHERWDGNGYPRGIREDEIPLISRIITVADSYEAMTAHRPYRKAMSEREALQELEKYSGSQFDPQIINVFIKEEIYKRPQCL